MSEAALELRLLGRLELLRHGRLLTLPPSKKSRALLAYLVATGRPHLRETLCDLLWEGPADPRAALRWSLTKIRPLLDQEGTTRLVADNDRVGFEARSAMVDLSVVRALLRPDPAAATTEALQDAAALFRGAFLEGLDLPHCYHFHAWCAAERDAVRTLQDAVLSRLIERLRDCPQEALRYARERLLLDPFSEEAHACLVRLLGAFGRRREALEQYESYRLLLEREFGSRPSPKLEAIRRELIAPPGIVAPPTAEPTAPPPLLAPLIGRRRERRTLERLVAATRAKQRTEVLLLTGEPGIGKTRLLEELGTLVRAAGGRVLTGRVFEAETIRPYGAWVDALRSLSADTFPDSLRATLSPLLPELAAVSPEVADRNRLFEAVVRLLAGLAPGATPIAVVLDDLQWMDEGSLALLHYVARRLMDQGVLFAAAARPVEMDDHPAALRLVRELRRGGRLCQIELASLDAGDTALLARSVNPHLDPQRIFTESGGNPLFVLEIARARRHGRDDAISESLDGLIRDRLAQMEPQARNLVSLAAALGRSFRLDILAQVGGLPLTDLLHATQELERRGILQATAADGYDFAHDLIRQVAYRQISEPRRRLIHLQIARCLSDTDRSDALAAEVAHHAALGGDCELAARACVAAGRHCLRVFAYDEAAELAARGLRQAASLPAETQLPLSLDLLGLYVEPGMAHHRPGRLEGKLRLVVGEARRAGLQVQVRTGFYLIANLYYQRGDFSRARESTLRAEEAGRAADPTTVVRAIADTARCLGMLERDMQRAERLAREAQALAEGFEDEIHEIPLALGLVCQHAGRYDKARALFERALQITRRNQDHWWRCYCLSRLPMIELERGRLSEALPYCRALGLVAQKMGESSEAPFAAALEAIARRGLGEAGADMQLDQAVERLRDTDSKWMLAYVQVLAAEGDIDAGRVETAYRRSEEALRAAEVVDRRSEAALAGALLARLSLLRGDLESAARHLEAAQAELNRPGVLSARARSAVRESARALSASIPTETPTVTPTPGGYPVE